MTEKLYFAFGNKIMLIIEQEKKTIKTILTLRVTMKLANLS